MTYLSNYERDVSDRVLGYNRQDTVKFQFNDTYKRMAYIFREELKTARSIEDVESDLIFEIEAYIERNNYDMIDAYDVADELYKDFNLKVGR